MSRILDGKESNSDLEVFWREFPMHCVMRKGPRHVALRVEPLHRDVKTPITKSYEIANSEKN